MSPCLIKLLLMQTEGGLLRRPAALVKAVVGCLDQLVAEAPVTGKLGEVFSIKSAPTISIGDYVGRLVKYMDASLSVFIYSLALLDRAQEYNPDFTIHRKNIHRLLLVSNLVAAKYLDDLYYKNSFYATVGGVSLRVINDLEAEFLKMINFNCHCEQATFLSYCDRLELFAEINQRETTQKENRAVEDVKREEDVGKAEEGERVGEVGRKLGLGQSKLSSQTSVQQAEACHSS